jgi:alkylation response protein AidB-like acyl-CoA dehydrogenase
VSAARTTGTPVESAAGSVADEARAAAAALLAELPPTSTDPEAFLARQFDAGLAWVQLPEGEGGRSWPTQAQETVDTALRQGGALHSWDVNPLGFGMGAPTVIAHGTPEQRRRFLRPLFSGEEIWCQLFSEPAAGSDLAGLEARAERDGDEWVVTGQKVWTSLAHLSRRGMLLARTDPDVPKHRGLTYFILDMASPGVEVRPLRQITGDCEFNEVFLHEVRIPDRDRIGEPGDGWRISMTTLSSERVALGGAMEDDGDDPIGLALRVWDRRPPRSPAHEQVLRDRLVRLWVRSEVGRLTVQRAAAAANAGRPGPDGSVNKLAHAELIQDLYGFCLDVLGPAGALYGSYDLQVFRTEPPEHDKAQQEFLYARCASLAGGTSEVLRNLLGEQVLGLPREPRLDKDRPWREVRNR